MEHCRYCKHWTQADTLNIYQPQMGICSATMVPEVRNAYSTCALHEPIMCTRCHKHPAYVRDICEYCDDYLEGIKRDAQEEPVDRQKAYYDRLDREQGIRPSEDDDEEDEDGE